MKEKGKCFFFFKIVHASCLHDKKLKIPVKFTMKFKKDLSDMAVLKVPSGKVWHVQLRKNNGHVWFENGLHEFMEYHSICAGHFLVFRYDGNSQFHVIIFNSSASEIEYPFDTQPEENQEYHSDKDMDISSENSFDIQADENHEKDSEDVMDISEAAFQFRATPAKEDANNNHLKMGKKHDRPIQKTWASRGNNAAKRTPKSTSPTIVNNKGTSLADEDMNDSLAQQSPKSTSPTIVTSKGSHLAKDMDDLLPQQTPKFTSPTMVNSEGSPLAEDMDNSSALVPWIECIPPLQVMEW